MKAIRVSQQFLGYLIDAATDLCGTNRGYIIRLKCNEAGDLIALDADSDSASIEIFEEYDDAVC